MEHTPDRCFSIETCRAVWYEDVAFLFAYAIEVQFKYSLLFLCVTAFLYEWWHFVCQIDHTQFATSADESERQCVELASNIQYLQVPAVLEGCHSNILNGIRYC